MEQHEEEVAANMERADRSVTAARELCAKGYYDFAASRAYYAAFYAATAMLLGNNLEAGKHSGVIALIHQHFVKTGELSVQHGKNLNWLFELRGVGDYGVTEHVSEQEAHQALEAAENFIQAIRSLL